GVKTMRSSPKFIELGMSTPVAVAWIGVVSAIVAGLATVIPVILNRPPANPEKGREELVVRPTPYTVVQPIKVFDPSVKYQRQQPESLDQIQQDLDGQAEQRKQQVLSQMKNDPTIQ